MASRTRYWVVVVAVVVVVTVDVGVEGVVLVLEVALVLVLGPGPEIRYVTVTWACTAQPSAVAMICAVRAVVLPWTRVRLRVDGRRARTGVAAPDATPGARTSQPGSGTSLFSVTFSTTPRVSDSCPATKAALA